MKLKKITVKNFRSIEEQSLEIQEIGGSYTYALIGVNESGKSSFLRAVSFFDESEPIYPEDFHDQGNPVEVMFSYEIESLDREELQTDLTSKGFDEKVLQQATVKEVDIRVSFSPTVTPQKSKSDTPVFKKDIVIGYTLEGSTPVKKEKDSVAPDFNLRDYFSLFMQDYFWKTSHRTVFWRSEDRYLISGQIDLDAFATEKEKLSVPLANCFALAGIQDIPTAIQKIKTSPAEARNLQDLLSDKVTSHIKKVWPDHPIRIKFQIDANKLTFLVEDDGVKYKAKTTAQRSDGFRQFISFLLTVSAENSAKELSNTLLLLDEPETHLHPQAQECLKDELIQITKSKEDNIAIYATHSNYMIDKLNIDRCFRVTKEKDGKTSIRQFKGGASSYSEVNYEVFDIASSDYHNELYGYIEENNPILLDGLAKDQTWDNKKLGKKEKVSLSKYIRHLIHHPENKLNGVLNPKQLRESIEILRELKTKNLSAE